MNVRRMLRTRTRLYWSSRWVRGAFTSETPAVIVGGSVRSGTTLIRTMLDSHPRLAAGPESWVFVYRVDYGALAKDYDISLEAAEAIRRRATCLAHFIDLFFEDYARRMGKARWVEKSPANVLRLKYIWQHFPRAKFVHMVRDGRDVACSIESQHKRLRAEKVKVGERTLDERIELWKSHVSAGIRWRGDQRYLEVKYEDLVNAPRKTMERVLIFLGEPWSDDVLQAHEIQRKHPHIVSERGTPEVRKPIFGSSVGRWRTELSEEDTRVFQRKAGALLQALGYRQ